jgi:hypothetical protein
MVPSDSRPDASAPYFDPGLDCEQAASLSDQYAYQVAITFLEAVELADAPSVIGVDGDGHRTFYLRHRGQTGRCGWLRITVGDPPAPVTRPTPQDARATGDGDLIAVFGDYCSKQDVKAELVAFLTGEADAPRETTTVRIADHGFFGPLPMPPERVQ